MRTDWCGWAETSCADDRRRSSERGIIPPYQSEIFEISRSREFVTGCGERPKIINGSKQPSKGERAMMFGMKNLGRLERLAMYVFLFHDTASRWDMARWAPIPLRLIVG